MTWFTDPKAARAQLAQAGYLADEPTALSTYLAGALGKPLLIEGPAGVGKTALAQAIATATSAPLLRLQCYEGLDEARALYEWNYQKQLLRIQADRDADWEGLQDDIFAEEFLLTRPLLEAIRHPRPVVLLIDELDKADIEFEGLLLEVLSDFQVTIPELGTITATTRPLVVLTSNATRELSEAVRRRCLFLHLDYPTPQREHEILRSHLPELSDQLGQQIVELVAQLRELQLRKAPSISESIDWARTLVALHADALDAELISATLGVVLKHHSDHAKARDELRLP